MSRYGILLAVGLLAGATSIGAQSPPRFRRELDAGSPGRGRGRTGGRVRRGVGCDAVFDKPHGRLASFLGPGWTRRTREAGLPNRTCQHSRSMAPSPTFRTIVSTGSAPADRGHGRFGTTARLVITTTWRANARPGHVSRKRTLSLEPDGILIVETSTPPAQAGEPWLAVQSRYRQFGLRNER